MVALQNKFLLELFLKSREFPLGSGFLTCCDRKLLKTIFTFKYFPKFSRMIIP